MTDLYMDNDGKTYRMIDMTTGTYKVEWTAESWDNVQPLSEY